MFRRIYTYWPVGAFAALLAIAWALGRPDPDPDPGAMGPGLNITIGTGLQGNGGTSTPLDLLNGTTNGQVVAWNGTGFEADTYCDDPSKRFCFIDEFQFFFTNCSTFGAWALGSTGGAGSGCSLAIIDGHPGVADLHTGTDATSYARFLQLLGQYVFGGNFGEYCWKALVDITEISDATNRHKARIGFMNSTDGTESTNAVEAVYDSAVNGDFWALNNCRAGGGGGCNMIACDGAGGTTAEPVTAGLWVTLEACVNPAGTSTLLRVNGTQCTTNTLKIPSGVGEYTAFGAQHLNATGAVPADTNFFIDYIRVSVPFGAAR